MHVLSVYVHNQPQKQQIGIYNVLQWSIMCFSTREPINKFERSGQFIQSSTYHEFIVVETAEIFAGDVVQLEDLNVAIEVHRRHPLKHVGHAPLINRLQNRYNYSVI